jgi:hypothetical protein
MCLFCYVVKCTVRGNNASRINLLERICHQVCALFTIDAFQNVRWIYKMDDVLNMLNGGEHVERYIGACTISNLINELSEVGILCISIPLSEVIN